MKNLTPELIAKAKNAKTAEELLTLAKANGVELTADEAATYFVQLNAKGALSDDDLDGVAGGGFLGCPNKEVEPEFKTGDRVRVKAGACTCGDSIGIFTSIDTAALGSVVTCATCGKTRLSGFIDGLIEKV